MSMVEDYDDLISASFGTTTRLTADLLSQAKTLHAETKEQITKLDASLERARLRQERSLHLQELLVRELVLNMKFQNHPEEVLVRSTRAQPKAALTHGQEFLEKRGVRKRVVQVDMSLMQEQRGVMPVSTTTAELIRDLDVARRKHGLCTLQKIAEQCEREMTFDSTWNSWTSPSKTAIENFWNKSFFACAGISFK